MIRQSSVFAIHTHGNWYGIITNSNGYNEVPYKTVLAIDDSEYPDTYITELPEDSFATTRMAFLGACATAMQKEGKTTNFATVLHEKGVQTVVCFNESIQTSVLLDFQHAFMISIGNGDTLGEAINYAKSYIYSANTTSEMTTQCNILMDALEIIGNNDMSATFSFE